MARPKIPLPPLGLVLVRLTIGWVLASFGWRWFSEGGLDGPTIEGYVRVSLDERSALIAGWAELVLLSNPDAIAFLTRTLALLFGIAFLCGGLTRPAGWGASFLFLHGYIFGGPESKLAFLLLFICALACAISRAGRRFGLDASLDEHFPSWLTWTQRDSTFLSR